MKCPCCGNEMQSGFVRAMGRGGVCWVTENRPMGAAVGCPGFLLLGKAPHSETDHVPAQRCAAQANAASGWRVTGSPARRSRTSRSPHRRVVDSSTSRMPGGIRGADSSAKSGRRDS